MFLFRDILALRRFYSVGNTFFASFFDREESTLLQAILAIIDLDERADSSL